ncbi:hypothetical protein U1Q18_030339 [Sarracenia purpurea var. burkii]
MGRAPCCDKANVKKGPWSPEEDSKLKMFIEKFGTGGNWIALPQKAGLKRCGKSCRLRWLNYLRPNIKHGEFSDEEDMIICTLFTTIGSRWSVIAAQLPGRTDNDIKNYWNTKLKKKLMGGLAMAPNSRKPKPYPPPLQNPQSQLPSLPIPILSPLPKDCNSYCIPTYQSLTGLDDDDDQSALLNNCNNPSSMAINFDDQHHHLLQSQESLLFSTPLQILMFGGDQASCCSSSRSDGSCSQISHGKEIKQEEMVVLQSYNNISNGFGFEDNNQKLMMDQFGNNGSDHHNPSSWTDDQKTTEYFGDTNNNNNYYYNYNNNDNNNNNPPLEYDLEDVISTDTNNNGSSSCNFFFFNDENKTQERVMYYY